MKVAILGGGQMGINVMGHLRDSPLLSDVTVYDTDAARLEKLRREQGVTTEASLERILDSPDIPLVFITASNDVHKSLAVQALEAGKAVMCEKPMATTLADAEAMVQTAERTGGFLQVGFELRYSHLYRRVKQWLDLGLLGKIKNTQCTYCTSAWGRHNVWRAAAGTSGGMFGEKLSHYVDLVRWWADDQVEEVYAVAAPNVISYYEVHDNYHCTYRFKSGAVSQLTFMMAPAATFQGDPLQNAVSQQAGDGHMLRYMIYGDKGAAETDVFPRTLKRWEFGEDDWGQRSRWVENETWDPDEDFKWFHNTHDQALDIVRRVAEGEPPMTSPRDALETTRLCFAAEISARERRPVRMDELRIEATQ
ncbi:Gfo/Idh/MocA family protein [Terriglobus roseus]|uniref:Predicted dehydrogenase n=1 Tax=Terriglobus roseus TaxID=392734 RepID=A0A1H4JW28_9BACT|nr:Gfo/Idh/MocA family oxidoreductase [Terriglobus roseus]SEB49862.1 Predicted dehydrogenase [Terriglobus roseus]